MYQLKFDSYKEMEARLYYWKFLATIKSEDAMIYTLNENINNILN